MNNDHLMDYIQMQQELSAEAAPFYSLDINAGSGDDEEGNETTVDTVAPEKAKLKKLHQLSELQFQVIDKTSLDIAITLQRPLWSSSSSSLLVLIRLIMMQELSRKIEEAYKAYVETEAIETRVRSHPYFDNIKNDTR